MSIDTGAVIKDEEEDDDDIIFLDEIPKIKPIISPCKPPTRNQRGLACLYFPRKDGETQLENKVVSGTGEQVGSRQTDHGDQKVTVPEQSSFRSSDKDPTKETGLPKVKATVPKQSSFRSSDKGSTAEAGLPKVKPEKGKDVGSGGSLNLDLGSFAFRSRSTGVDSHRISSNNISDSNKAVPFWKKLKLSQTPATGPAGISGSKTSMSLESVEGTKKKRKKNNNDDRVNPKDESWKGGPAPPEVIKKWESFCTAEDINTRRYEILMAVQMSTQANPRVVHEAMGKVAEITNGITPKAIRELEYEELKDTINRVHWNKVKAKYIQSGAVLLGEKFNDQVPVEKSKILEFPGIGPELGHLIHALFKAGAGDPHRSEVTEKDPQIA